MSTRESNIASNQVRCAGRGWYGLIAPLIACALMAPCVGAVCGPKAAFAYMEMPREEMLKKYPPYPYEAVGTTDAAKKKAEEAPKEFVPSPLPGELEHVKQGSSADSRAVAGATDSDTPPAEEPLIERSIENAFQTTLAELLDARRALDGKMVVFQGEAIGDIINAGNNRKWVLLDDNGAALSVLLTADQAKMITNLGRYGVKGTTLKVTGVYHIADAEEAGELDVRAYKVEVVSPGERFNKPVHLWKLVLGLGLCAIAAGLGIFYNYLRKRSL